MVAVSVAFSLAFAVLALGLRAWIHLHRTGQSPFRSRAGISGALAAAGLGAAFAAGPILDGVAGGTRWVGGPWIAAGGILLATLGLTCTIWAQFAMGSSWRIGVDPGERTALVTSGPFRLVRNPIYTSMMLFTGGLFLMVPNAASLAAVVLVAIALDLHVRRVEEPVLAAIHGDEYRHYMATVGRFFPRLG
jgi:protein-S-isoprenylcysteine O-methyltransferase Ste14